MRKALIYVVALCGLVGPVYADSGAPIAAAVGSADRPVADASRDASRKPAELLAFSGVKPGDVVADLVPGKGYFTRLFSKLVGPSGTVFAVVPAEFLSKKPTAADEVKGIAAEPAFANVTVVATPVAALAVAKPVDVAWTSQNYHDIYGFFGADQAPRSTMPCSPCCAPAGSLWSSTTARSLAPAPPRQPQCTASRRRRSRPGARRRLRAGRNQRHAAQPRRHPRHGGIRTRNTRAHRSIHVEVSQARVSGGGTGLYILALIANTRTSLSGGPSGLTCAAPPGMSAASTVIAAQ